MMVSADLWGTFDRENNGSGGICRSVNCSKLAVLSTPCKVDIAGGIHARLYLCAECGAKVFSELFPLPPMDKAEEGQVSL